jgi:hypothetical protein
MELVDHRSPPHAKIALFRSLFRGRDDVYLRRFESQRTGKSGYAPACANEWVRGICEKPRIKCAECANRRFRGFFVAVDFDRRGWLEDAAAFLECCRGLNLLAALERSRSGLGAHVWMFFESAIPAAVARALASHVGARCL